MGKGFRTIFVGAATALIGLLEAFDITSVIPDKYDELALAVVGAVMVGLRLITTGPVGNK